MVLNPERNAETTTHNHEDLWQLVPEQVAAGYK